MTTIEKAGEARGAAAAPGRFRAGLSRLLTESPLLVGLLLLVALFTGLSADFLTLDNLRVIGLQSAQLGIVAVGVALLVLCGHVDLSVGSTMGLCGVLAGYLMTSADVSPLLAVLVALGAGATVGALNGVMCAYLGFSPIVVTLGMLTAVHGVTFLITSGTVFGFGDGFGTLGNGSVAGIPVPVLIAAAVFALGAIFLTLAPGGRHVYAIGVNREAAYLAGIPVRRLPFVLFVLTGLLAALAGLIETARLDSAPASSLGVGFELNVLTAVLLGGIAFNGGRGNLLGVLAGVLFLGVLQNGLAIMNVPFAWQAIASGLALVLSIGLDSVTTKLSEHFRAKRRRAAEALEAAGA